MRFKKVEMHGFRSIEKMEITFEGNGHKILVGKNESGKSNILNALNLLSGKIGFDQKDKKELYGETAFVRFQFELETHEIDKCRTKFAEKFPASLGVNLTKDLTVQSFFEEYSRYLWYVVVCGKNGYWTHSQLNKNLKIEDGWHSVDQKVIDYELHEKIPAGLYISEGFIKIHLNEEDQVTIRNCLSPISLEDVFKFLRQIVRDIAAPDNYTFPISYWKYDAQEHDLPSSVEREAFSQKPDSCIPLKNMFLLAGIQEKEIHSKISEANDQGHNRLKNLFDRVNTKTNEYIKKSWKDYKKDYSNVEIELRSDGEDIVIGIRDSENTFDFKQRSDGFRRFISFLLLISTEFDTGQHVDTPLILIDEPETGLHPSSAKDLKDKLIELGQKNTIVYATHSISMIDTENIKNNLIVSKDKENTTFEEAKEDGTSTAENVYQAIGHSIYQDLKKKNILLEGYTDKRTLRLFMKGRDWKDFGICYTGGAKNIKCVVPILELASRKYFVLSDGDDVAKREKKNMADPDYWYTYEDLGSDAITIEDFYERVFFMGIVQKILKQDEIEMPDSVLFEENDRMKSLNGFLAGKVKAKNVEDADGMVKRITREIKIECAKAVTEKKVMKEKITKVLDALLERINDSQSV